MADTIDASSDSELVAFARQYHERISSAPADFGLTAAQATDLQTKITAFDTSLAAHVAAQADAQSIRQTKDADRETLENALRSLTRIVKAAPATDAGAIEALGLGGETGERSTTATRPLGTVDTSQRLQHTINFADEAAPESRRRPRGTIGCEIFVKIGGAPPADDADCQFLTLDTRTPYVAAYDGAQAGQMAHYLLRWRLRDGATSAWSETVSATITG